MTISADREFYLGSSVPTCPFPLPRLNLCRPMIRHRRLAAGIAVVAELKGEAFGFSSRESIQSLSILEHCGLSGEAPEDGILKAGTGLREDSCGCRQFGRLDHPSMPPRV